MAACDMADDLCEDFQFPETPKKASPATAQSPTTRGTPKATPKAATGTPKTKASTTTPKSKKAPKAKGAPTKSSKTAASSPSVLYAKAAKLCDATEEELAAETTKAARTGNPVPPSVWTHNELAEGDWKGLAEKCLHKYVPASPADGEAWRAFCSRRTKYLNSLTATAPAPDVKWGVSWAMKVASAEYRAGGRTTPRAGGKRGPQRLATKASKHLKKKLSASLRAAAKQKKTLEGKVSNLQERIAKIDAAMRKIVEKAADKGIELDMMG